VRTTIGIAIDVPEPWGGVLTRRRAAAGDPAAAAVPAHLTLVGPTEVDNSDLGEIEQEIAKVAAEYRPFTLHLRGTGTFRPVTDVVFVVVAAGIGECERLAARLCEIPAIDRPRRFPYHPHVTVAHDVPAADLDAVFADLAGFEAHFPVRGFTLFEHDADGRWRAEREYVLGDGAAAPPPSHRRR
jgi:2'-5' RNA ligase